jgi:hypothetical protein
MFARYVVSIVADEARLWRGLAGIAEAWDATIRKRHKSKPNAATRHYYDKASAVYQQLHATLRSDF